MAGMKVVPITEVPWGDVAQVFGTRGDPAGCWCQYFKVTNAEWKAGDRAAFESMLRIQATEPRTHTPRIFNSKVAMAGRREPDDDESIWALTCLIVKVGHRRKGIAAELVSAAVEFARRGGAKVVEGYPVDPAAGASSAELLRGSISMFEAAGFTIAARPTARRAVARLELS